jgi:hypothetical protein
LTDCYHIASASDSRVWSPPCPVISLTQVKGQHKHDKHIICNNCWTNHHRDFQLVPKCFYCDSLSHRRVIVDLGSMTFPNTGSRIFLGQGQFSKIINFVRFSRNVIRGREWNYGYDACVHGNNLAHYKG